MEISGKAIIYSIIFLLVLFLLFVSLGIINLSLDKSTQSAKGEINQNMPEKCQVPSGQDIKSWKEHLGHHAETQDCLKYFN